MQSGAGVVRLFVHRVPGAHTRVGVHIHGRTLFVKERFESASSGQNVRGGDRAYNLLGVERERGTRLVCKVSSVVTTPASPVSPVSSPVSPSSSSPSFASTAFRVPGALMASPSA